MMVQTKDRHLGQAGVVGLHIGLVNVQQYFPRELTMVELEFDHLSIVCSLEPSFWEDRPEIHDLRLSCWLESKRTSGKLTRHPAPVALIPRGEKVFRLQLVAREESEAVTTAPAAVVHAGRISPAAGADTSLTSAPAGSIGPLSIPALLPAILPSLDKRHFNGGHLPERRGVGKLNGDERPSPAANH